MTTLVKRLYEFLYYGRRNIKEVQKYEFTLVFNKGGLRETNKTYLR